MSVPFSFVVYQHCYRWTYIRTGQEKTLPFSEIPSELLLNGRKQHYYKKIQLYR